MFATPKSTEKEDIDPDWGGTIKYKLTESNTKGTNSIKTNPAKSNIPWSEITA